MSEVRSQIALEQQMLLRSRAAAAGAAAGTTTRVRPEPATVTPVAPENAPPPPPEAEDAPAELSPLSGSRWSVPNAWAMRTLSRRVLRTAGPILIADLLALAMSAALAHAVIGLVANDHSTRMVIAPLALAALIVGYWLSGLYVELWVHPVIEFRQITRVTTVALLAAALGGLLAWPLPLWCAAAWLPVVALVPLLRTIARHLCVRFSWWGYPTLVIGTGKGAAELAAMLLDVPRSTLRPVLLTDPQGTCEDCEVPAVNDPVTCESIIRMMCIQHAVVSLPEYSSARLAGVLDHFSNLVPHLLVMSDTTTLPTLWGASRSGGRISGVEVRNALLMTTLQVGKRALDIIVATLALLGGLPLLVVSALLIKYTDHGPLFYGHTRIGRHGKEFKAWKLRTMHTNAKEILEQKLAADPAARKEWVETQKLRNDPRVTRIGRFLRKTSLDELPQLWNVVRGEMSLVGPRPIVEDEVIRYGRIYAVYVTVKPGITGLWQVSGRSNLSYRDRILLDQFYIRHWSLWLDVYILAKTIYALMDRDGAY